MMKAVAYFQKRNECYRVAEIEMTAELAACVDVALEHVYASLQNIQGSWSFGPNFEGTDLEGQRNLDYRENVTFVGKRPVHPETGKPMGARSMMIGDLITLGGKVYEVADYGFKEYVEEAA